jgi:hypothetical protein
MRTSVVRGLSAAVCLALALAGAGHASAADWSSSKKKSSKHHKKRHHKQRTAPAASAKSKGGKAAPPEEEEDEGGDDSGDEDKGEAAKDGKKKIKLDAKDKGDTEESGEAKGEGEGEEGGDTTVIAHKSRPQREETAGGGALAFELTAGAGGVHRSFDFNDPLSNYQAGASRPYSYSLPVGPTPFVGVGFYPGAFAGSGIVSQIGLVGRYEKLIGTKTSVDNGPMLSTFGQEYEVGVRARQPLAEHEVGLMVAYGKHSFHVSDTDPGPTTNAIVPNVDYTFIRLGLDGRLGLGRVSLGAHAGTRLVRDTGPLGTTWFPSTKTTTVEGGVWGSYALTPLLGVVAGVDYLRYAFNFNPVPTTNAVVAGGAVDQYISGYVALRVSIAGE